MFGAERHKLIFYVGVALLGLGMMLGTVPTSIPQFILLGNWLIEGRFKSKWQALRTNPLVWVLGSVFLIHVLGLLYTSDLKAGWGDVRTKIPLLLLPLLFFSSPPITRSVLKWILLAFIIGCVINVSWCLIYYYTKLGDQPIRQASRYMSHIRLSLLLTMALVSIVWCFREWKQRMYKWSLVLASLLILFAIFKLALMTAIVLLLLLLMGLCIYTIIKWPLRFKWISFTLLCMAFLGVSRYVWKSYQVFNYVSDSPKNKPLRTTPSGRLYELPGEFPQLENGFYVYRNIESKEVQYEWNRRFPQDSFNFTFPHHKHIIGQTLIRYMSSKGLTKDSLSVAGLTEEDHQLVVKGVSNYAYPSWNPLKKRLNELFFEWQEFQSERDVSGHSLSMRLYYWKTAVYIIQHHLFFGVGTGDSQKKFNKTYAKLKIPLQKIWWLRSHNQFLAITVALGMFGLCVFLVSLIYPFVYLKSYLSKLYVLFFLIALFSFLLEDTLESQTGLTFFAFFNTLFLSVAFFKKSEKQGNVS